MKKLLAITALTTTLIAPAAFAKTQGNYVELDELYVSADYHYQHSGESLDYAKFKDSSVGVGLSYKHAFNYEGIFLAPGVFVDRLNQDAKDSDDDSVILNYRYGAKLDLGYDITDNFAVYFTNGISKVTYKINWNGAGEKDSGSTSGYFYGGGLAYQLSNDVTLNLEYNAQSLIIKTPESGFRNTTINQVKSNIGVAKIGISYHF